MILFLAIITIGTIIIGLSILALVLHWRKSVKMSKRELTINGKKQFLDLEGAIDQITSPNDEDLNIDFQLIAIDEVFKKFEVPQLSSFYFDLIWARGCLYWTRSDEKNGSILDLEDARRDMLSIIDHPQMLINPHGRITLQEFIEHVEHDMKKITEKKKEGGF